MKNDCLDAATAVLDEAGISYSVGMGGKHPRIDFEVNGRRCRSTVPGSSSDRRAHMNSATEIRRLIRQAQAETQHDQEDALDHAEDQNALAFLFEGKSLRVDDRDGAPWFVAADICVALELSNPSVAVQALDPDERAKLNLGRQGEATVVSESGLYTLILRSRGATTPGTLAHRFRKWVTGDVLPSLRKHGAYAADPALMRQIAVMAADLADVRAAADLALEAAGRLEAGKVAPTVDLAATVTSDDLIALAGIKPGQRVRGTSAMVTGRVLTFTAGHGCFKTPAHLNPSMPWRFPREKATEWLFGISLGAEQIRGQIERQNRKKAQRRAPGNQGHLSLVAASASGDRA